MAAFTRSKAEAARTLDALAQTLLRISAHGVPVVASGLGEPRACSTAASSLRHLSALCRAYRACLVSLRADLAALIAGAGELPPEECERLSSSITANAELLLRWDALLERSSYVGVADNYRQIGRGLGFTNCRRLAYCCSTAAGDPAIEAATLLDWIDAPAWFGEVEQARRAKRNVLILLLSLLATVGGLAYALND
jgi:hypothetical protein